VLEEIDLRIDFTEHPTTLAWREVMPREQWQQ
jgi:hypothetical protein